MNPSRIFSVLLALILFASLSGVVGQYGTFTNGYHPAIAPASSSAQTSMPYPYYGYPYYGYQYYGYPYYYGYNPAFYGYPGFGYMPFGNITAATGTATGVGSSSGFDATITIISPQYRGYDISVDGKYIGTDGKGGDALDRIYTFKVAGNQQHLIRVDHPLNWKWWQFSTWQGEVIPIISEKIRFSNHAYTI